MYVGGEEVEKSSLLCTGKEFTEMYQRNIETVYRMCRLYLKNHADAEDATQSVFLKALTSNIAFNGPEHEKAWLITTAKNHCKDVLKHWWRSRRVEMDTLQETPYWDAETEPSEVLSKLFELPEKYKTVLYLFYVEEYSVREVAEMLKIKESTIRTRLLRGRERLRIDLRGESSE
jgi:RNA polymerase sigma-70 factor (ECF subfamily)